MVILGLSGFVYHDAAAALLVDGRLVAAAEEERFCRQKHAKGRLPESAVRFCLQQADVRPTDVDLVAFPYASISIFRPARWHYAWRHWYAPDRALDALVNGNRRYRRHVRNIRRMLRDLGFPAAVRLVPVEHHLAHASSAYHLSGFRDKAAILSIDGKGEYTTTLFGYGEHGRIRTIREFYDPDSLGGLYAAFTEYLGFEMLDGEFKVMGMAAYGDPERRDLSRLLRYDRRSIRINNRLVNVVGLRRYKERGKGYFFSPALVEWLGPPRKGDHIDQPYVDYAAALQRLLEHVTVALVEHFLGDALAETGRLCLAGGVALNVKLNQRLLALPQVRELFVQPAAGDAGTGLGAAAFVGAQLREHIQPLEHVYLGPAYTTDQCLRTCEEHAAAEHWQRLDDPVGRGVEILAAGQPLAWFQGAMEFGPRALGNRSILAHPARPGMADTINAQVKYRERWRPFCPSILEPAAEEILGTTHPAPYMTLAFHVQEPWRGRLGEVVHKDDSTRPQVVTRRTNPRYYRLIEAFQARTGLPVLLNTSLNRRGEPMVCSPKDALDMFFATGLRYLIMEDVLVTKGGGE